MAKPKPIPVPVTIDQRVFGKPICDRLRRGEVVHVAGVYIIAKLEVPTNGD